MFDPRPPRPRLAASQARDNDVEDADDAVDDGHADGADAVDDRAQATADGGEDLLDLRGRVWLAGAWRRRGNNEGEVGCGGEGDAGRDLRRRGNNSSQAGERVEGPELRVERWKFM